MPARILITGGAGTLGQALAPVLLERGDQVRALDIREPTKPTPGVEWVTADLREATVMAQAVEGVDAIVHAAAWHGIHLRDHPAKDFWELNVDATYGVYAAAADAGIERIVLCSTMGVYGESRRPAGDGPAVRIHERLPLLPGDVYGLSKVLAEQTAAYFDRARQVRGVALRFGMFVPEPFLHAGIRFLYGGVDERDVAAAVLAALEALRDRPAGRFDTFNIESRLPYTEDDARLLRTDPMTVLEHHWPDAPSLLEAAGALPWGPINEWYDIAKAGDELSWQPRYGFPEFLEALRSGRTEIGDSSS